MLALRLQNLNETCLKVGTSRTAGRHRKVVAIVRKDKKGNNGSNDDDGNNDSNMRIIHLMLTRLADLTK